MCHVHERGAANVMWFATLHENFMRLLESDTMSDKLLLLQLQELWFLSNGLMLPGS